jgi:SAM-dependent methyltransferase
MWDRRIAPHVWNQYHAQLDLYFGLLPRGRALRILDVGCAQATLALLLAERGHDVTAVDIRPQFLDYARTRYERGRIRFLARNAMELDGEERYDVVFANQIVEHVVRPVELLEPLVRLLVPGGRLVVSTPNGRYFRNDLPAFREIGDPREHLHREFSADGDGHFFAYEAEELHAVMREAGCTRVRVHFAETPWISGHVRVRHAHRFVPPVVLRTADRLTLAYRPLAERAAFQLVAVGRRDG